MIRIMLIVPTFIGVRQKIFPLRAEWRPEAETLLVQMWPDTDYNCPIMKTRALRPRGVVVIGGHINGIGIIRSFAARKIPTAVILTQSHDFAHYSRYISSYHRALEIVEKPEMLVDVLDRRSAQWKGWALFPVNDEALAALVQGWRHFESSHPIIAPPGEIARYFLRQRTDAECSPKRRDSSSVMLRARSSDDGRPSGPCLSCHCQTARRSSLCQTLRLQSHGRKQPCGIESGNIPR